MNKEKESESVMIPKENWPTNWQENIKSITRPQLELICGLLIIFMAFSVFLGRIPSKQHLSWDKEAIVYQGTVLANKPSGEGKLTFENGDSYQGTFKNGLFHGKGTFVSKSGWIYVGEFKNGVAEGQGKLTTETNIVYEGRFEEGIYQDAR